MIYSDILRSIRTVDNVGQISFEIDTMLESVFKTQKKTFEKSLGSISTRTSQAITATLRKEKIDLENKTLIKDFLMGLKDQIRNLKSIEITLPFYPSEEMIENLFSWVLKNLGFGIILNIKEDREIIGGAIISFNGKYKDYSLKKKIDEAFATKKQEITIP